MTTAISVVDLLKNAPGKHGCTGVFVIAVAAREQAEQCATVPVVKTDVVLGQLELALPSGLEHDVPAGLMYHYTHGEAGLEGILRNKVVWATQFEHLNDKSELVEGDRLVHEVAVELNAVKGLSKLQTLIRERFLEKQQAMAVSTLMREICVASFSEAADEISQWREYGGRGAGYSLGLRFIYVDQSGTLQSHVGAVFKRMEYDAGVSRATIREGLEGAFERLERFAAQRSGNLRPEQFDKMMHKGMQLCHHRAGAMALSVKHSGFKVEQEWRAIAMPRHNAPGRTMKTRLGANGLPVPYVELPLVAHATSRVALEELWVGPTADAQARAVKARALVESLGYSPEVVKLSKMPIRG